MIWLVFWGLLTFTNAQDCASYGQDCAACVDNGCEMCVTEGTTVLYENDFESPHLPWTQGSSGCQTLNFNTIDSMYGGQGELGLYFCQINSVETMKNTYDLGPTLLADPDVDPADYGDYSVGSLPADWLGMHFTIDVNTHPYLMIELDVTGASLPGCGGAHANTNPPRYQFYVIDEVGMGACNSNGYVSTSGLLEGVASTSSYQLKWTKLRASLDISMVTSGEVTITMRNMQSGSFYAAIDNIRILSSTSNVEIPRSQVCASAGTCADTTSFTATTVEECPCDLLSSDCRDDECFRSSVCAWCGNVCCDDFTPGATAGCPDCGDPSETGYVFSAGGTLFQDERSVSCEEGYGGPDQTTTCQEDGTWSAMSQCELGSCGEPDVQPGVLTDNNLMSVGESRATSCADGYSGTDGQITCQTDLTWSAVTTVCTPAVCEFTQIEGYSWTEDLCENTFPSTCLVEVADGYEGIGLGVATCQADGTWSAPDFDEPLALTTYLNEEVAWVEYLTEEFVVDAIVDYITPPCTGELSPFIFDTLDGDGDGGIDATEIVTWTVFSTPEPVECSNSELSLEGYISVASDQIFVFQDARSIDCEEGYEGTPADVICQADATWSTPTGCSSVSCDEAGPAVDAGLSALVGGSTYQHVALVVCGATGYEGYSVALSTCQSTGTWSEPDSSVFESFVTALLDESEDITVQRLEEIVLLLVTSSPDAAGLLTQALFGVLDQDASNLISIADELSVWSTPSCELISCGEPTVPELFIVADGGSTYLATRDVSCAEEGLVSGGPIECQATGEWTDPTGCSSEEEFPTQEETIPTAEEIPDSGSEVNGESFFSSDAKQMQFPLAGVIFATAFSF